jgi:hypothetical protein
MNAPRPLFPNAVATLRLVGVVGGCGVLSACVGNPFKDAKVDPASPVAADVARLTRSDAAFPTFASIPKAPQDIRPDRQFGQAADQLELAGAELVRETAPGTWTLQGTDDFAAGARRDAGPDLPPPNPAEAEAFARELRERATPPPPR